MGEGAGLKKLIEKPLKLLAVMRFLLVVEGKGRGGGGMVMD